MYTLGIGDVTHDVSVFLLKDQTVLVGIEAERLNRIKHGLRLDPTRYLIVEQHLEIQAMLKKLTLEYRTQALLPLIEYCLKAAQIKWSEIDQIVVSSLFDTHPYAERALALPHHLAHAASTFYTSPFEKAAILAIDGYGTVRNNTSEAIVFGAGSHLDISMIHTIRGQFETTPEEAKKHGSLNSHMIFSNSLGVFYQNITLLLGLGYHGEGKTMGLAAYGKPNSLFESLRDAIIFEPDGTLQIHNRQIFLQCKNWLETARDTLSPSAFFQYKADLALTHQTLLETMIFHLCRGLYERTGLTHLCLAGGVALNSVANGKITAHTPFKHVFIPPPAGDNGIALGAALYGVHAKARLPRISHSAFSPYVGRHYSEIEIQNALSTYERKIQATPLLEEAPKKAAELLNEGKILAWFDGGSEVGPRALGNRSILADPRPQTMKDYLNQCVKHRESFRPFAPACLEEDAHLYFEIDHPTPYMLEVAHVKKEAQSIIPAVTHVDGSARLQTVSPTSNPMLYALISHFKTLTGVGVLLNTSLNGADEPICETPQEAIECFLKHDIDALFLNGIWIQKK